MRASRYFMATLKEIPKEAEIISHQLMLRAGMIQQVSSGIYSWLPLGLKVLKKIETIVREEQNAIGALEMLAPTLQPASLWQESGRYEDYGKELLRIWDRHEKELLYGPTAEEVFTDIFRKHIQSYKHLPVCLYNIQWKFRDEIRPRFGVMRGREFLMKDAYSFDLTEEGAHTSYRAMFQAYLRTFRRMGLSVIPVRASTGPIGGTLSHEFQILAKTGESTLYYDGAIDDAQRACLEDYEPFYAMADEQHNAERCPIPQERLVTSRGIEVGHIFYFGTKYSKAMGAHVMTSDGKKIPVEMGSYGIGVSRLVGAMIEAFHDSNGICWPVSVAPFPVAIAALGPSYATEAETYYRSLMEAGLECFLYDLPKSQGSLFAELDLVGIPYQVFFGESWKHTSRVEIKHRSSNERTFLSLEEATSFLTQALTPKNP